MLLSRFLLSLLIVSFGQPLWSSWLSILAALCGYALFWSGIVQQTNGSRRFWIATLWFTLVQLVQLFWLTSHPYAYIYAVYLTLAFGMGLQFGLLTLCLTPQRLQSFSFILAMAGLWSLFEWMRLFLLAGFTWNPAGLSLTANLYSLQMASPIGLYGLSFWVILVNLFALRVYLKPEGLNSAIWLAAALLPYLYGAMQISIQAPAFAQKQPLYNALLIQTAFPAEEEIAFSSHAQRIAHLIDEWRQILKLAKSAKGKPVDLIVLPEFVVPYGTYTPLFPYPVVKEAFSALYGPQELPKLPLLQSPFAEEISLPSSSKEWFVNNLFWLQGLANLFNAEAVAGLEDAEDTPAGSREYYSSAIHLQPNPSHQLPFVANRYEKRVLMPMGEYIPFEFCRTLAAAYGIQGSLTPGKEAKVFGSRQPLGLCICYEETFGHLIRENSHKGAQILVNVTNDGWYPHSLLPRQHFDHARVRTVENGLPLLRACNTGITGAIDSLGRIVAELDNKEEAAGALYVQLPLHTYPTLYRTFGDTFIVLASLFSLIFYYFKSRKRQF